MDLNALTLAAVAITAVVEGLQKVSPNYITGIVTIVVSVLVGALFGFLHLIGLADLATGAAAGLLAAGGVTVVQHVGVSSNATGPTLK